jgi:hypothetical protein
MLARRAAELGDISDPQSIPDDPRTPRADARHQQERRQTRRDLSKQLL